MRDTPTILAKSVRKILDAASKLGVKAEDLCRAVSLDAAVLKDPDSRIPFAQVVALYQEAARLTKDSDFGLHIGESAHPRLWDVLGYAFMNSPTLRDALNRLIRFLRVWTDGATYTLELGGSAVFIEYRYRITEYGAEARRHDCEKTFAAIVSGGRLVTGVNWAPEEVCFEHQQPESVSEHERIFKSPVRFKMPANVLSLALPLLDLPLLTAEPGLCDLLDRHAEELLAKSPPRNALIDRVRALLREGLKGGDPGLDSVARQLGMSARSLQRRLTDDGTSYKGLLDEMRRGLSTQYLDNPDVAIYEVAYLLGFSEHSAFDRAFRRWTGLSPREYRSNTEGTGVVKKG